MSDAVAGLVAQALKVSPAAAHVVARTPLDHQSNRLYDVWVVGRHLIAKEFLKLDELHDAPVREWKALELLAPLDIAPQPVLSERSSTPALGPIVVYEWMEGEMWDRHVPHRQGLAQLADVWLKMHALPTGDLWVSRGFGRPLPELATALTTRFALFAQWVEAEFAAGQRAVDLCWRQFERLHDVVAELAQYTPVHCFCRADPRFANVIQRPDGRLGLVDWEDSGLRDPAMDVADLITHPNQEDLLAWDEWQAFLDPYLAVQGAVDPYLRHRIHLYTALFPIFFLTTLVRRGVGRVESGQLAQWTINGLPPNERLRRFLARAMAWPEMGFAQQLEAIAEVTFFPTG
jgi:hypothetical protein